jgi:hypothetical protein
LLSNLTAHSLEISRDLLVCVNLQYDLLSREAAPGLRAAAQLDGVAQPQPVSSPQLDLPPNITTTHHSSPDMATDSRLSRDLESSAMEGVPKEGIC